MSYRQGEKILMVGPETFTVADPEKAFDWRTGQIKEIDGRMVKIVRISRPRMVLHRQSEAGSWYQVPAYEIEVYPLPRNGKVSDLFDGARAFRGWLWEVLSWPKF